MAFQKVLSLLLVCVGFKRTIMKHANDINITLHSIFNHCERIHLLVGS